MLASDKAICWSKVVNIVSAISVNMAAPSPNMCPVLICDTTLYSVVDGISLTETCPLWLGSADVHYQGHVLVLPQP